MLSERLPVHIDPIRLAEAGRTFSGRVELSVFRRLGDFLSDNSGDVRVELTFGVDEQGIRYLAGRLQAVVTLTCQRCLKPMKYSIDSNMLLGVVSSAAESEQLPEAYEPLLCGAEPLYLNDIIEDELILSLPIVAKHADGQCSAGASPAAGKDGKELGEQRKNPFAVLASLKSDGKA